jgi:hypothetical protein
MMDRTEERNFLLMFVSIIVLALLFTAVSRSRVARDNAVASARGAAHLAAMYHGE